MTGKPTNVHHEVHPMNSDQLNLQEIAYIRKSLVQWSIQALLNEQQIS